MTNVVPYCVRQNRALVEQVLQLGRGVGTPSPKEKAGRGPHSEGARWPSDRPVSLPGPAEGAWKVLGVKSQAWPVVSFQSHQCPVREDPAAPTETAPRLLGAGRGDRSNRRPTGIAPRFIYSDDLGQPARFMSDRAVNVTRMGLTKNAPFYEGLHRVN